MRIALFGGSFNPPHVGHLLGALYVRAVADVDAVWLMPAFRHPFGKVLASFDDRVALCESLAALVDGVEVTRIEEDVESDGRTIHTVEHLKRCFPQHSFRLVIGTDILHEAHRWYEFDRLVQLAPLLVLGRSGHHAPADRFTNATFVDAVPMPEVSSTEVRRRLASGEDVSGLVPRPVIELIEQRGLYGSGSH